MCDEVFDEKNFVANIIWQKKYSPQNDAKFFSDNHDFILCYQKGNWKINQVPRTQEQINRYKNPDNDIRGVWKSTDFSVKTYSLNYDYPITLPSGRIVNPPSSRCWVTSKERFQELVSDNRIWFGTKGDSVPALKKFLTDVKDGTTPITIWSYEEVGHNQSAKQEMKAVLHDTNVVFDTPKPAKLIERILKLSTKEDTKETPSVILDFFAGSGTTQHAVMQLNAEDGGNRQCILVTNNENNIAEEVCYERNKRVINGYTKPNGTEVKGLTNNHLHYYTLDWFDEMAAPLAPLNPPEGGTFAYEHSSIRLARLMREMLMIKENCFEDIEAHILRGYHPDLVFRDDNHPDLDVLESADKYMVIIYTDDAIVDGVHIIEQLPNKEKLVVVYPFEYQSEPDPTPFEHITEQKIKLKALPNSYKETYDHILQDLKKRRRRFVISDEDAAEGD